MIYHDHFFYCFLVLEVVLQWRRNRRGSGEMPISAVFLEMRGTGSTLVGQFYSQIKKKDVYGLKPC